MDLETFRWLLTDDGQALLAAATVAEGTPLEVQRRLRGLVGSGTTGMTGATGSPGSTGPADEGSARVAAALGQVELRRHATPKFGPDAVHMYFTRDGLAQATGATVGQHRAHRVALAGPSVVDLTCGIGGDLVAFARAGLIAAGIDLDLLRVEMARANLAALGLGGAVAGGDATALDVTPFAAAYADPGRRGAPGRAFHAEDCTPPWAFIESLLSRRACVRVVPRLPQSLIPGNVEAEWVSDAGEVQEAVLWSPALATVSRRATVIGRGGLATLTDEDDSERDVGPVGAFLYEPDDAVIRAGLVPAVAAGVQGHLLDRRIAYVTSDAAYRSPFARSYRVIEELPYHETRLRAALRQRHVGTLRIIKRGVDVASEPLRQRLALRGDQEATIVLTRVAGERTALRVEPLPGD